MTDPVAGAPAAPEETARAQNPPAPAPTSAESPPDSPVESLLATPAEETAPDGESPTKEEATAPAEHVPVTYAPFTLPEGVEVDTAALEEAQSLFAEARLSQPQAQKLVDLYAGKMNELIQRQILAAQDRQKAWVAEVKNDPDLGGRRFEAARAAARTALNRFGTPELRRALDELGVSNSPQLFRFFVRVGRAVSEESWAGARADADADGLSAAATLYPQQNTGKE